MYRHSCIEKQLGLTELQASKEKKQIAKTTLESDVVAKFKVNGHLKHNGLPEVKYILIFHYGYANHYHNYSNEYAYQ